MAFLLSTVAAVAAVVHLMFAFRETVGWSTGFVEQVAPDWAQRSRNHAEFDRQVDWAAPLAANMAGYNLALAIGFVWLAVAGTAVAGTLGLFLAIFLLIAAFAAWRTGVMLGAWIQGGLGIILLLLVT